MCADAYHASLWHTHPKFFAGRHAGHLLFRKVPHNGRNIHISQMQEVQRGYMSTNVQS